MLCGAEVCAVDAESGSDGPYLVDVPESVVSRKLHTHTPPSLMPLLPRSVAIDLVC